ncbi:MAG: hypothetical protein ACE149_06535 [Armatimonadota bacterium]
MQLEILSTVALAALLLVASSASEADEQRTTSRPDQPDLIVNGDFASDSDGDGMADGWQFSGDRRNLDVTWSRQPAPKGGYAQQLTCTRFEGRDADDHVMLAQYDSLALRQGHWYRLSFAARGEIASTAAYVAIRQTDPWEDVGLSELFRVWSDWRRQQFVFRASKDISSNLRLQIWFTEPGAISIADVQLREVDPSERPHVRYTDVLPDMGSKNLLPNGSFECGASGWGSVARGVDWGGSGLCTLFGTLDRSVSHRGGSSFRIDLDRATAPVLAFDYFNVVEQRVLAPLLSNRGWVTVQPGQDYTFSAYVKADPSGAPVAIRIGQARGETLSYDAVATADWQRIAFTFRPTAQQLYVAIGPDLTDSDLPRATLWVDEVQLEKATEATDYAPRSPLEIGLEWERPGHLFASPDEARAVVTASNATGVEKRVRVTADVTDFFDRPVAAPAIELVVPPGGSAREPFPLGVTDRGFYRFRLQTSEGAVIPTLAERFGVIEFGRDSDGIFGMNHAYPAQELLAISRDLGLTWYRDWSLKWHQVEPEKGRFDFDRLDFQLDRVRQAGMNVIALLPFPSSEWSTTAPTGADESHDMGEHARLAYKPRDLSEWGDYVRTTVAHCRDRIRVWEVLNEPLYTGYALPARAGYTVQDYVDLLRVAYQAIKAEDPGAFVIGGIAADPQRLSAELVAAGGLDYLDAINIHIYPVFQLPERYERPLQELNRSLAEAGKPRPIYFTEGSYYGDDDLSTDPYRSGDPLLKPLDSELECASYQARFNVILLSQGVRSIIYHSGTNGWLNDPSVSGIFFEWDGAPRKMAVTQSVMTALFGSDVDYLGQVWEQVRSYAFHSRGRTIVAAWDEQRRHHLLTPGPAARVLDLAGGAVRDPVELGITPYYVVLGGARSLDQTRQALAGWLQ